MFERARSFFRQRREARAERLLAEAQYLDEAQRVRLEHATQKLQGQIARPKALKHNW